MSKKNILRQRNEPANGKVSFAELFFDLVFVYSITQLSHTIAHHFSLLGALESGMLIFAVWWIWIFTTWVTNWLDPERMELRLMIFVLMLLGLLMSMAIPGAFGESGMLFALTYVITQLGRTLFMLWALRGVDNNNYRNFLRIFCWLATSAIFWISGALAHHEIRIILWLISLGIEFTGPLMGFAVPGLGHSTTADWTVSGEHMAERCALFIIICFGETVLATGRSFAEGALNGPAIAAFLIAFITSIAMWWIYFRHGHHRASHLIEHAALPGAIARSAFTYAHIPIITGIILSAVVAEFVLAQPDVVGDSKLVISIFLSPAIFIFGNLSFKTLIAGRLPLSHLVGLALLALSLLFVFTLSSSELYGLTMVILIIVAVWEHRSLSKGPVKSRAA